MKVKLEKEQKKNLTKNFNLTSLFLFFLVSELTLFANDIVIKKSFATSSIKKNLINTEYNGIENSNLDTSISNSKNININILFTGNTDINPPASFINSVNSGNGIYAYEKYSVNGVYAHGNIINDGNISTMLSLKSGDKNTPFPINADVNSSISANGIFSTGNISNKGNISTILALDSGDAVSSAHATSFLSANAIYSSSAVVNDGDISTNLIFNGNKSSIESDANSLDSGNGIYALKAVKNTGNISTNLALNAGNTNAEAMSSGNGIYSNEEVSNDGNISTNLFLNAGNTTISTRANAIASSSSNGIYAVKEVSNSGNISTNLLLNAGTSSGDAHAFISKSGNGIFTLKNISNSGNISAISILKGGKSNIPTSSFTNALSSNNGVYTYGDFYNNGNVSSILDLGSGSSHSTAICSGNGAYVLGSVTNTGVISGYLAFDSNKYIKNVFSGNGVSNSEYINNYGVIKGSQNAIGSPIYNNGPISTVNNYGILGGEKIINNVNPNFFLNYGTTIVFKDSLKDSAIIDSITSSKDTNYAISKMNQSLNILNAEVSSIGNNQIDSFIEIKNLNNIYKNYIINGAGNSTGALTLANNSSLTLDNSIINAYKTSVTLNNNSSLVAKDTIFNGGGLKGNDSIIVSEKDTTSIFLEGLSVVNGNILLKGNDSLIAIDNSVKLNGDINSLKSSSGNKIQLGKSSNNSTLNISKNIDNFDKVDIIGKVNLLSGSSINRGEINLNNGKLNIMLDTQKKDSKGKLIGHALYNHIGKITKDQKSSLPLAPIDSDYNSSLIFYSNSINTQEIISMNKTDISNLSNNDIGTNSLIHTANKRSDGDVEIDIKPWKDLDYKNESKSGSINSEKSEKIYDNIANSKQIGLFFLTTDLRDGRTDSLSQLSSLFDQIYNNSPYSYGGLMSKYSIDMFREGVYSSSHIMPKAKEYISTHQVLYSYNKYSEENYSSYSNTSGLLGTVEYGINSNNSLGFSIGGATQNLTMDYNSDLKSKLMYLGLFYKSNINNFKFTSGLGYQYSMYESKRNISNKYQSFENEGEFNTNSFNIYEQVKYTLVDNKKFKIEPKVKLNYTYVNQETISEDNSSLAINIDQINYDYFDFEVGVDFSKEISMTNGLIRGVTNIAYINSQGTSDKSLIGTMKNSTNNFDIQCQTFAENNAKIGMGIEIENNNGMIYSLGTDVIFSSKNQKNINLRVGLGYSF